ncbi:MAG: DUF502 domain-containing protein [Deltaproteobacteria bacterium]|nr:DUF502 domain-containing protein [Deltaproteobacteria bacterium]
MRRIIKRYFVTGLLIVVPVYITGYIFFLIVTSMDSLFMLLPVEYRPESYLPFHIPGLGLLVTIIIVFLIGFLATNFLGRKLVQFWEWFLSKIPVVRSIYKATKQFIETFFVKDEDSFRRVVMLQFPRKGLYAIGFVTCTTKGEIQARTPEQTINIFVPTTPNPTSGFYFAVPEEDVIPLNMTVEEAFKVIMSGGLVAPEVDKDFKTIKDL